MATFTNTVHKNTIDTLVDGYKEKLKNPYYMHMDSTGTLTTYFNQNITKSTLDEGSKTEYIMIGKDSPIKFNKVNNFYIYGLEKINFELENSDFGLSANDISGEGIILPNTLVPIANDYFIINHINQKLLFKVTSVSINALENGSNMYKIEFILDKVGEEVDKIYKQIENDFEMVITNVGTQFNSVIRSSDYNFIDKVEDIVLRLNKYYLNLFYNTRVQTFTFTHKGKYFYDPYMIEFIKKHSIISDTGSYIHVAHQTFLPNTFSLDYDRTFFRLVEHPDLKSRKPRIHSQAEVVDEYLSILCTRPEDYYKIEYVGNNNTNPNRYIIENFDIDLIERIYRNELYENENYINIIIKYFNNIEFDLDDIYSIEDIDYEQNITLFYHIPILIYILNNKIKNILRTNK